VRIYNAGLKCAACGSLEMQDPKNRHLGTIGQLCRAISLQLRHVSTIGKKLVKQQYLLHMSSHSQYGELWPTRGWDHFVSLGQPSKFQRVSCFGFVTAATLLNGSQPNFALFWPSPELVHYIYIFVTEFCQVQHSLCVQGLCSPILAALLHCTLVVDVSRTLRRWTEGATYIRQGGHHVGHWPTTPHSSSHYRQHCAKRKPAGI